MGKCIICHDQMGLTVLCQNPFPCLAIKVLVNPCGKCTFNRGNSKSMNMTESQKRLLTELLGECWSIYTSCQRTFATYQDLGDVKDALVKKELYFDFYRHCEYKFFQEISDKDDQYNRSMFSLWLFRPLDEHGNVHFCWLVAEYIQTIK